MLEIAKTYIKPLIQETINEKVALNGLFPEIK